MKQWKNIIFLILIPVWLLGIEGFIPPKSGGFVSIGVSHQQWDRKDFSDPIQQTVAPIVCFYPLAPHWYLNVSNSPATASMGDLSLSGLSDTWIRTTYITPNERFMFNIGIGAPTGKTKLTDEEFGLVHGLSENVFRFRLPSYGQGLNVKVGGGMAVPMQGGTVFGLGLNYMYKSAYQLKLTYDEKFDPGEEINVVTGFSVPVGQEGKWSTDIVYSIYSVDQYGDIEVDAGDKILINTSLAYKLKSGFFYGALRFRQRGKNELFLPDTTSISKKTIGDQIETDGLWQFMQWPKGGLSFLWDGRFYSKNEDGYANATVYGLGFGVQHQLSQKMTGRFQIKYLMGTINYSEDIDVNGINILASLKFRI